MSAHEQSSPSGSPAPTAQVDWGRRGALIIVPLDGSIASKAALPVARLIARTTGAALQITHAVVEPLLRKDLLRQLKLSRREETVGLMIDQVAGPPAEAILRTANEKRAILIAMTTHGETAQQEPSLGPVTREVLHAAQCPVVLVRPEAAPRVAPMRALQRILLPLDGAPSTTMVVAPVVSLAERIRAELEVLYVSGLYAKAAGEPGTLTTPRYVDQPQYEWPAWALEAHERFCAVIGECPSDVPARVFVRSGSPVDEIVGMAAEREANLIALEWRGKFDPEHAEIVRGVLERTPVPVLLVPTSPGEPV